MIIIFTFFNAARVLSSSDVGGSGCKTYRSSEPNAIFLKRLIGSIFGLDPIECLTKSNVSIFNCFMSFKNCSILSCKLTNNLLFDDDFDDFDDCSLARWTLLRKSVPISGLHDWLSWTNEIILRWRIVCKPGKTPESKCVKIHASIFCKPRIKFQYEGYGL